MTSTQAAALLADLIRTFGILDTTQLLADAATTVAAESEEDDAEVLHFAAKALTDTAATINKA